MSGQYCINITAWKVSIFHIFLVSIFPHLDWIRRDTPYLSIFSPDARKYGPEKLQTRTFSLQSVLPENVWKPEVLRWTKIEFGAERVNQFMADEWPSGVYSEHCQSSKMEGFAKIVNGYQPLLIFANPYILNVPHSSMPLIYLTISSGFTNAVRIHSKINKQKINRTTV